MSSSLAGIKRISSCSSLAIASHTLIVCTPFAYNRRNVGVCYVCDSHLLPTVVIIRPFDLGYLGSGGEELQSGVSNRRWALQAQDGFCIMKAE